MVAATYVTEHAQVGETELMLLRGGTGRTLMALHGIEGHEGWLELYARLSGRQTVLAPSHPGYGHTPAAEWITSIPHQAVFYNWFLQSQGFEPRSLDLLGVGVGGWIAAQMAIMCPTALRNLILVDAAGIKPTHTEPLDVFITPWRQVIESGFSDPNGSDEYKRLYGEGVPEYGGAREAGRTMSVRMCFKPYMHDPALPGMLAKIETPTLIVWGKDDRITPLECGERFRGAIRGAELRVLDDCGHFAQLEQPEKLAEIVQDFCGGGAR